MRTRSHLRCLPKNHLRYPKNTIYVYGACHALAPLGESGRSYGAPGHFLVFKLRTERTYGACHEFPFAAGIRSVRSELCVESPDQEGIKLRQEHPVHKNQVAHTALSLTEDFIRSVGSVLLHKRS